MAAALAAPAVLDAAQEQQQAQAATNAQLAGTVAGMLAKQLDPNQKAIRAQLKRDRAALKANDFGPSMAERLRQGAALARQRAAARSGIEQQLDREAAAVGFGRSGGQDAARTALAGQEAEQAAAGMGAIEQEASRMARADKAAAMSRLGQAAASNIAAWYDLGSAVGAKASGGLPGLGGKSTQDIGLQQLGEQGLQQKQAELDAQKAASDARIQNMLNNYGSY